MFFLPFLAIAFLPFMIGTPQPVVAFKLGVVSAPLS
jgi:hypothetical protein